MTSKKSQNRDDEVLLSLTLTQQDIYFDQLHHVDCPLYNVGGYIKLGRLDVGKIVHAHQLLVQNYDAFGLRIVSDHQAAKQYISEQRSLDLPFIDFSDQSDPQEKARCWLNTLFTTQLEIENCELFRSFLVKLSDVQYYYIGFAHHLIMDGWGFANWAASLGRLYNDPTTIEPTPVWQSIVDKDQKYQQSSRYLDDKAFWSTQLENLPQRILPPFYQHLFKDSTSIPSRRVLLDISNQHHQALCELAKAQGSSVSQVYMMLVILYFTTVYQKDELVIGTPAHNRKNHQEKSMIGVFTSVSPFRVKLKGCHSIFELLRQLGAQQKANFRHQRYPIGQMQRDIATVATDQGLYDIAYNYLKLNSDLVIEGEPASLVYLSHDHEQTPLMITLWEYGEGQSIQMQLDHNLAYFNGQDMTLMAARFEWMIDQCANGQYDNLHDISIINPKEQQQIQNCSIGASLPLPADATIHQLFEQQVAQRPESIAVSCATEQLTYLQLDRKANRLAHCLLAQGVNKSDLIGVSLSRTCNIVVAVLAILKTGAAYVPLDPSYPKSRLDHYLADTGLKIVVSEPAHRPLFEQAKVVDVSDSAMLETYSCQAPNLSVSSTSLINVIYTSGSTGLPKGVQISHSNVVAFVHWAKTAFSDEELTKILASTSLNFDLSVFELFVPLCFGHQLVVVDNALSLINQPVDISLINTVPSAIKALLAHGAIPTSVKTINLAGEPLSAALVNDLIRSQTCQRVCNLYGPTEDTVYSTYASFTQSISSVPVIGRVIANSQAWVMSDKQQLVPLGVAGELYLGGSCISRGYLGQAELTAERFIDNPFGPGKLYRTGDLVRYQSDGQLVFLGRLDDQVKVRGFRIELGEVEYQLSQVLAVNTVVVTVSRDQLVAFVALQSVDFATVQQQLRERLPDYMIPSSLICIEQWPLLANGKVDKKALKVPQDLSIEQLYLPPNTATESQLCQIWGQILEREPEKIGIDANFFALGGHSLLIAQLSVKIAETFALNVSIKTLFSHPTIAQQAQYIEQHHNSSVEPDIITALPREQDAFPLSFAQQQLWLVTLMNPKATQYHMSAAFEVTGEFDVDVAEQAIAALIGRHESLRTVFTLVDNQPTQKICHNVHFSITRYDLSTLSLEQQSIQQQQILAIDAQTPFDLSKDLMLRAKYLKLAHQPNCGILLLTLHHIAADGYSLAIIIDEFKAFYLATKAKKQAQLIDLPVQYVDYAHWQKTKAEKDDFRSQANYWKIALADIAPLHSLRLDFPRPAEPDHQAGRVTQLLPVSMQQQLQQLAQSHSMTLFMVLHSALSLVIARHSEGCESVIGTPVANRMNPAISTLVGFFVNTLVLRTRTDFNTLTAYLAHVREVNMAAQTNQEIPFEQVVELCQLPASMQYSPLFQIMFSMNTTRASELSLPNVQFKSLKPTHISAKFDLDVSAELTEQGIVVDWTYALSLFEHATIEALSCHFKQILQSMIAFPQQAPIELPMLSELEVNWLLNGLNNNNKGVAEQHLIHQLFEQHTQQRPDQLALVDGQQQLSYQALNEQANRLAHYLLSLGVNTPVAICVPLSVQTIVAILAVLKTGGSYVPLDSNYPAKRLEYMLEDSGSDILICVAAALTPLEVPAGMRVVLLDSAECIAKLALCAANDPPAAKDLSSRSLAYIIYTSGSTGQPKGVCCEHRSILNLVSDFQDRVPLSPVDRFSLWTSISFDVSVYEIFSAFAAGGCLYLVPETTRIHSQKLFDWLKHNRINSAYIPPFYLNELADWCQGHDHQLVLKRMLVGVEPILIEVLLSITKSLRGIQILNGYGPSEATVCCTLYQVDGSKSNLHGSYVPIGTALANTQLYVVDTQFDLTQHQGNCLAPFGAVGELYIGGMGLARSYWHNPELTAERFISNPFDPKDRWYRTGDLVRYLPDGNLMFIGRVDEQIKIRGFRVELGEIEKYLVDSGLVYATVVTALEGIDGTNMLVAYCVISAEKNQQNVDVVTLLRQYLTTHLPDYMVPSQIILLDALPLTPNGKVDRKALPKPDFVALQGQYFPPENDSQRQLVEIWSQLLNLPAATISIKSSFFDLGGQSLLGARLIAEIDHRFDFQHEVIGIKDIFNHPQLESMALRLDNAIYYEKFDKLAAELEIAPLVEVGEL